jgi:pimeloyl-ACP methyl ester carboxylesterase
MRALAVALLVVLLVSSLVAGCRRTDDPPAPPFGGSAIELETPGGTTSGALYGTVSDRGIVVVADDSETAAWAEVASELGRSGYRVIVLPRPARDGAATVRAAAERLAQQGVKQTVFVGSGRGASAALAAAADGASGVGVLNPDGESATVPAGGLPPVALLVMASLRDGPSSAAAQQIYRAAREPRTLALYPAQERAPAAFAGESNELRDAFFDFLRSAFQPLTA